MPTDENANGDGDTPQQSPSQPLPPPIEGNENGEGEHGESRSSNVQKTKDKPEHWTKIAEAICAILLVLITGTYTYFASQQACAALNAAKSTQRAVTNADKNFRIDERAWIAFVYGGHNLTLTVGKPFSIPTTLENTGKTPAHNVEGNIVVTTYTRGTPLDFTYSAGHASYRIAAGTLFPSGTINGGTINESFQAIKHGEEHTEAIIITKPLLDQILSSEILIVVYGKLTYRDIFGVNHWTTYCRIVSNPSLIPADCMRYNDTDDN